MRRILQQKTKRRAAKPLLKREKVKTGMNEPIKGINAEISDPKNRYAFEWYMKEEDRRYWERTKKLTKKITALAATGAVIGLIALLLATLPYFNR
jgi:hypothetical protein